MKLLEVKDDFTKKEFIKFPVRLYKDEPYWIRPLDNDIDGVFDRKKNKYFRHGDAIRWILQNDEGETIGRIAAFINEKTANKNDQPTGGVGFFECINDKGAAHKLFDAGKNWLSQRGMEAMDGPINFGDRDRWWGCLVDGFDKEPNYCCNYNFPYYRDLFESYGFQLYFEQYTFGREVYKPLDPKYEQKAREIINDPDYVVTHLKKNEMDKWTGYFVEIYNKAWAGHKGVPKLQFNVAKHLMNQMKPVMDEKVMYFTFYKNEPVAFFVILPEVNQVFKYVNGRLDLLGKMKFLYHQLMKTNRKIYGVVFGVVPEHQKKGVDGAMIVYCRDMLQYKYKRYDYLEMNWIGDFNPKMINMIKYLEADRAKTHITFRKLFDENKPFKRHPII